MPEPRTPDLAAIRARLDDATPGPWIALEDPRNKHWSQICANVPAVDHLVLAEVQNHRSTDVPHQSEISSANAEFIAHAPADIRALLALVDQQAAEIARLSSSLGALSGAAQAAVKAWESETWAETDWLDNQMATLRGVLDWTQTR